MRRVIGAGGAATLALLIASASASADALDSRIDQGRGQIGLTSEYEAPTSGGQGTPGWRGGGQSGAPAPGGDGGGQGGPDGAADAAPVSTQPQSKDQGPKLRDVLDIADRRGNCDAGIPLVACQPDPPEREPERESTSTVTREEVFEKAVDKIQLTPPTIGASPCLAAPNGCMGTVGVPVWLWVEDGGELPSESAQASAGPFSVRAEATVSRVEWSLGDGQSTICTNAGTVFDPNVHGWSVPDCGFETGWEKAGTYTLTATYLWDISWSGDVNGSTTRELSSSQDVTVREIQAVVDSHSA